MDLKELWTSQKFIALEMTGTTAKITGYTSETDPALFRVVSEPHQCRKKSGTVSDRINNKYQIRK